MNRNELTESLVQIGRDEAAQHLANLLDSLTTRTDQDSFDQHYIDGVEDALNTLVNFGANDPRDAE